MSDWKIWTSNLQLKHSVCTLYLKLCWSFSLLMKVKGQPLDNLMLTVLLMRIFILSNRIFKARHPVRIAGLLVIISLLRSLFLGKLIVSWVIYLLALVFLGGVIVVLLFMVSVCANEKFFYRKGANAAPLLARWIILRLFISKTTLTSEGMSGVGVPLVLYQREGLFSFILFIGVLVLCMLRVVKIRKLESGPLVKRL